MIGKLGTEYVRKDGVVPPKKAKYRLYYWWFEQFFEYQNEAEDAKAGLPYYQQEDAFIEPISRKLKK